MRKVHTIKGKSCPECDGRKYYAVSGKCVSCHAKKRISALRESKKKGPPRPEKLGSRATAAEFEKAMQGIFYDEELRY